MTAITDLDLLARCWRLIQRSPGDVLNTQIATMEMDDGEPVYYILTEQPVVVDMVDKTIIGFIQGGPASVRYTMEKGELTELSEEDALIFWRRLVEVFEPIAYPPETPREGTPPAAD
jgi:hypothetical protein